MKFTNHHTDLYILCETPQDEIKFRNYCIKNKVKAERQFSNVDGQDWFGKHFWEIPFGLHHRERIEAYIVGPDEEQLPDKPRPEPRFRPGNRVIVNTGGEDTPAIIDYQEEPNKHTGKRAFYMDTNEDDYAYLCRFTEDPLKTIVHGAIPLAKHQYTIDPKVNYVSRNAQFIPGQYIRFTPNE